MTCAVLRGPGGDGVAARSPESADAAVNFATEKATVSYDPAVTSPRRPGGRGAAAGYDVASRHAHLPVSGMTCASCVARVEKAVQAVPGVVAGGGQLRHREG